MMHGQTKIRSVLYALLSAARHKHKHGVGFFFFYKKRRKEYQIRQ